jgi:hypothetical protein
VTVLALIGSPGSWQLASIRRLQRAGWPAVEFGHLLGVTKHEIEKIRILGRGAAAGASAVPGRVE